MIQPNRSNTQENIAEERETIEEEEEEEDATGSTSEE